MKLKLENVRLAFPALFEAKTVNGEGEPAFSASFLMPPDHPAVKQLSDAFEAIGKDKWGAKWPTIKKEIEAKDRLALHDGDTKADYAGFEGNLFVSSRNSPQDVTQALVLGACQYVLKSTPIGEIVAKIRKIVV